MTSQVSHPSEYRVCAFFFSPPRERRVSRKIKGEGLKYHNNGQEESRKVWCRVLEKEGAWLENSEGSLSGEELSSGEPGAVLVQRRSRAPIQCPGSSVPSWDATGPSVTPDSG